jgi:hypothetical protein
MRQEQLPSLTAVSKEVEFIARFAEEADIIKDEGIADPIVTRLTKLVYSRADADVLSLLNEIERAVTGAVRGLIRIGWKRPRLGSWNVWGTFHPPRGPKRQLGNVGLEITWGKDAFRLLGWVNPRGNSLTERQRFAHQCSQLGASVLLISDNRKRYQNWEGDAVIWMDIDLSSRPSIGDLVRNAERESSILFPIVREVLKRD